MIEPTPGMKAGDKVARAIIPVIQKVARALPAAEQRSCLLGFLAHLFGFLAARHSVQMALDLIDEMRPIVERMGSGQERKQPRH